MNQNLWRHRILALRVFGITWTVLHVFYGMITGIVILSLLTVVGAVPFLYGAFVLKSHGMEERVFRRAQRALIGGGVVWLFTDSCVFFLSAAFYNPTAER